MSWWTGEKIRWYERAAGRCDYHRKLAMIIENRLKDGESVLELGCGLGRVAPYLAQRHSVKAIDIDAEAIECARRRENSDIYYVSDWRDWKERADAVLAICFGHLDSTDNLLPLLDLCRYHIIYVFSLHRGQCKDLVLRKTKPKEQIEEELGRIGLSVSSEVFTLSFPQPLLSLEEAENFIRVSYLGKDVSSYMPYVVKSGKEDYPYTLLNEKEMALFDIRK